MALALCLHVARTELRFPNLDLTAVGAQWHPDGRRLLALHRFPDEKLSLWWIAADGSDAEELTSPPSLFNNAEGWPNAPDGRKIAYGASVDGHIQMFEFDLGTRQARRLSSSPDDKFNAIWSPDGRWIVYASNANGSGQLWRIPSGGGKAEPLTKGDDRVRHTFYSPDGRWLYFQPNHLNICRMPADGGPVQQVTNFLSPGCFSRSRRSRPMDDTWCTAEATVGRRSGCYSLATFRRVSNDRA